MILFNLLIFQELGLDFDMFEEDQMMRAIAMSLGQDVPAGVPATEQPVKQVLKLVLFLKKLWLRMGGRCLQ